MAAPGAPRPTSLGSILGTALLITFTRPTTWLLALAAFLVRGGIVWFILPIIALPTPVQLANTFGPSIVEFVFGGLTLGVIALIAAGAGAVLVWLLGGGWAAAALEGALVRDVVGDEELATSAIAGPTIPDRRTTRVLAVRLVAMLPLLVAVVFGAARIVDVTYAELTIPSDTTTPIAWRVIAAVPDAVVAIVVTWVLGEVLGALAARRVLLRDPSIARSLGGAASDAVRHPLRTAGLYGIPTLALLLVLVPAAVAASVAWSGVAVALADPGTGPVVAVSLLVFIALWAGGLVLAGGVCAWRQATWTVAAVTPGRGTFGGSATGRPGDWKSTAPSGTF